ncbi:DNA-binding protein [Opitutaceae bacterium TAV5]|nr:DNA-binding protein [Opitutaceae bacterium TAV5]
MQFAQAFATTLRTLRTERDLTQEQLAERSGVHLNSVGLLERAAREPSLYIVFQLAKGLGMTPAELVRAVTARNPRIETRSGNF